LVGLGHGASTFCGQINGFVIEEDLVGEESCFSETVIRVPADAMPFVPPAEILVQPSIGELPPFPSDDDSLSSETGGEKSDVA
ncbi:hypothetical protein NOH06_001036, partial [Salmonella enterica]|nr:hypothetical protein [Salmonella enterica]